MTPTEVFETYWKFAAERQAIYFRRMTDRAGPWTDDPILRDYRFTNAYRAADRVSQYLIREVQYREDRPSSPKEIFFRTILFKLFNKIETWEAIEQAIGPVQWRHADLNRLNELLDALITSGRRIYSAAYIMPAPPFGHARKHANHLALLSRMMEDRLPDRIRQAPSLETVYDLLVAYPGIGPFLAFQYAIDLNYSDLLDFDENDFVVAGPGALDGIAKCFERDSYKSAEDVIYRVADEQWHWLRTFGVNFRPLAGRALRPIDCQNLFCEISKYARIAHPDAVGVSNRTKIKQRYAPARREFSAPFFPPRWGINAPSPLAR